MACFNTDLPLKSLKAPMVFKVKNHDFTTDPAFSSLTRFDKKDGNIFNARLQRRIIREINSIKKMYYKHHYMFEFMEFMEFIKKKYFYIIDWHFVSQKCYVATSSTSIVFTKKTLEIWFIIL